MIYHDPPATPARSPPTSTKGDDIRIALHRVHDAGCIAHAVAHDAARIAHACTLHDACKTSSSSGWPFDQLPFDQLPFDQLPFDQLAAAAV